MESHLRIDSTSTIVVSVYLSQIQTLFFVNSSLSCFETCLGNVDVFDILKMISSR